MVVLYDRDCGFCAWLLAWLLRWDRGRRLRPAPIQGPEGDARLAGVAPADRLASWHAVDADGRVFSGGAALTEVLRRLPGGSPLARATARVPRLTERAYAFVATNRRTLARPLRLRGVARARASIAARAAPRDRARVLTPAATCAVAPVRSDSALGV
jgi:predicted DCC family thiol-disulfide oxidoreductase YuxK